MTKNYSALRQQALDTLPDNTKREISPQDQREMHVDTLEAHNNGTLIVRVEQVAGLPVPGQMGRLVFDNGKLYVDTGAAWQVLGLMNWQEDSNGDLVPVVEDIGVGSANNPANHIAIGTIAAGMVGAIVEGSPFADGLNGVRIIGTNDLETINEPIRIAGNAMLLTDGAVYLGTGVAFTADRHAILRPTTTLADGTIVAQLAVGPEVNYGTREDATPNASNVSVPIDTETTICSLTAANGYAVDDQAAFNMRIEASATNRDAIVTVRLYIGAALEFEETFLVSGSTVPYGISVPLSQAIGVSDVVESRIEWTKSGGGTAPTVNVRGDIQPSNLSLSSL